MLKVFGRKKTSDPPPAPARLKPSAPRPLGSPPIRPGEQPPPLYARFATRGESFDSSSTRGVSPNPAPSTENLREEYTRNRSIYGNESVTRFGSQIIIANPASSSSSRDISPTSTGEFPLCALDASLRHRASRHVRVPFTQAMNPCICLSCQNEEGRHRHGNSWTPWSKRPRPGRWRIGIPIRGIRERQGN